MKSRAGDCGLVLNMRPGTHGAALTEEPERLELLLVLLADGARRLPGRQLLDDVLVEHVRVLVAVDAVTAEVLVTVAAKVRGQSVL